MCVCMCMVCLRLCVLPLSKLTELIKTEYERALASLISDKCLSL